MSEEILYEMNHISFIIDSFLTGTLVPTCDVSPDGLERSRAIKLGKKNLKKTRKIFFLFFNYLNY